MFRKVLLNTIRQPQLIFKSPSHLATLSLRRGSSWKKIAPHAHINELEGDDINAHVKDHKSYGADPKKKVFRAAADIARGLLWEHGVPRKELEAENEQLPEEEQFDIIGASIHMSKYGVDKNGIKVWGAKEFPNLSFYGIPGVEIQNEVAGNPFECYISQGKPLQLHTLTLGESTDPENSFTFCVHPNYYDTVALIQKWFYKNKDFKKKGEKPWKLKHILNGVQADNDEIDVCDLQYLNGGPVTDIWDAQREALLNPNPLLKSLNCRGIEVYNGFEAGEWSGHILDDMLMAGKEDYVAIAGNDAFFYRNESNDDEDPVDSDNPTDFETALGSKFVPLGSVWGIIDDDLLKESPIKAFLNMINSRQFYASSGIKIHTNESPFESIIQRNGNKFRLESFTDPVQWKAFQYNNGAPDIEPFEWTPAQNVFEYECKGDWRYVRFEAREKSYVENYQDILIPCKVRRQVWLQPFFNN